MGQSGRQCLKYGNSCDEIQIQKLDKQIITPSVQMSNEISVRSQFESLLLGRIVVERQCNVVKWKMFVHIFCGDEMNITFSFKKGTS